MRELFTLLLLGLSLEALPQVVKAEYFFDNTAVAYGQGTSLTVPSNTGNVDITADLTVSSLSPGFHQAFFRVKDAVKGWSPLTPKTFLKLNTVELFTGFSYGFNAETDVKAWTYQAFTSPSANVSMDVEIPVASLSPGFNQIIFRAKDAGREWSTLTPKTFLKPDPHETIVGFKYCFDAGTEAWTYRAFPSPSTDVGLNAELDLGTLPKGIHYFQAMAKSATGKWSPISRGTFFNIYTEPLDITSLEYFFEDGSGVISPLYIVNNFTPSPHVTLDSLTFSVPVSSLENLKMYFVYFRAVDVAGNRSFFMKDTIVYHSGTTGIGDLIHLTPELMIYPNPASEMVNLKLSVPMDYPGDFVIRVFDDPGVAVEEKLPIQ